MCGCSDWKLQKFEAIEIFFNELNSYFIPSLIEPSLVSVKHLITSTMSGKERYWVLQKYQTKKPPLDWVGSEGIRKHFTQSWT